MADVRGQRVWPMADGLWTMVSGLRLKASDLRLAACVFMTCGLRLMGDVSWPVPYELLPSPPLSSYGARTYAIAQALSLQVFFGKVVL